ncbi:NAD(P)/FAD-dependent oxidoreductase [Qipengyuania sediminis]|uniref:NAD(P)/FAD-dependent oxidoreductase n=1 Tax=Qipengyuania sediminis TaxID=1532023 RepID=UPI00105925E7|nr:NAD(P)/FAD-dependent oxidoreductase [Qipengyuania sediminis]
MTDTLDVLVVGAGAVGLACARALALAGREVIVADRHPVQAMETSSRNSEVIHAGIYYQPGSLKAKLCVAGREAIYRYAAERAIAHRRCGKIIVASGAGAEEGLAQIEARALAAGAGRLQRLSRGELARREPAVRGDIALFSPATGIIDSHALTLSYLADLEAAGGAFARNTSITGIEPVPHGFTVHTGDGAHLGARAIVNCAGLHSGVLARSIDGLGDRFKPTIRYARGIYFKALPAPPFRHLVYPLPTNASLGIHATIDLAGQVRFGPDVEWIADPYDYTVDPSRADLFVQGIGEYWPEIESAELVPDYAGIRPKLVEPGDPPADFRIDGPADHGLARLVCLHGIESPGLTASLAIGALVASRLEETPLPAPLALLHARRRGEPGHVGVPGN